MKLEKMNRKSGRSIDTIMSVDLHNNRGAIEVFKKDGVKFLKELAKIMGASINCMEYRECHNSCDYPYIYMWVKVNGYNDIYIMITQYKLMFGTADTDRKTVHLNDMMYMSYKNIADAI